MRKPWLSWWLGLAVTGVGAQHAAPLHAQGVAPRIEVVPHEDLRRVDVLVDGKPFTSYIWPTTLKKPALYPVRAASGAVVTRGWPLDPRPGERVDHPHQVGLWFDHGDVNGLDFWNNSNAIPPERAAKMGTIVHRAVRRAESGSAKARSRSPPTGWTRTGRRCCARTHASYSAPRPVCARSIASRRSRLRATP